jgi:hypothetical protein
MFGYEHQNKGTRIECIGVDVRRLLQVDVVNSDRKILKELI